MIKFKNAVRLSGMLSFFMAIMSTGLHADSQPMNALSFDNGQIVAILVAVDQSEIAAAEVALPHLVTPAVIAFAEYLKKHHTENLVQLSQLQKTTEIQTSASQQLAAMQTQGNEQLKVLSAAPEKGYDALYLRDMVNGHAGGLKLIDTELLKQATNPQLKAFLVEFRKMVARHLEIALELQKKLTEK